MSAPLKRLQSELSDAFADLEAAFRENENLDREIERRKERVRNLKFKIQELTKGSLIVSEHAVLRYMERVMGIDIEKIKLAICGCDPTNVKTPMDGVFPIADTHNIRIKGGVIVTVWGRGERR